MTPVAPNNQINTTNADINNDVIDFREYWNVVRRNFWSITGLAIAITLVAIVVVFSMSPVYRATSTIMIESQHANVVSIEEVYGATSENIGYFYSQLEIIKSRAVAKKVVENLNLTTHPELDPRQQPAPLLKFNLSDLIPAGFKKQQLKKELTEEEKEKLIFQIVTSNVMSNISVKEHKKSLFVSISYQAKSPKLAAQVSTEVANTYIENGFESNLNMTEKAVGWLTERLGGLKEKLVRSEQDLIDYRKKENLLDVQGVQTLSANELDDISHKLSDARRERSSLQASYSQIQRATTIEQYESISGILNSPSVQAAKDITFDAQRQVSELSKRYGVKHPKMQLAQVNYEKAKNNYLRLLKSIASGIKGQYQIARNNESRLKKDLKTSKAEIRHINAKSYQLQALEREVETNRQLYDTFFTRFKETNETSTMQSANARVIDSAVVPYKPIKPRKTLIISLAFIFGIFAGVVLALLRESLNNTIRNPAEVELKLQTPLLGILPLQKLKRKDVDKPLLAFHNDNRSNFSEAIRSIRTGVVLSGLDSQYKIAVITSSIPNEGKTTLSLNLALALGQTEKVLLIDADLRKPSIAKSFQYEAKEGLSSLVAGTADFSNCIKYFEQWKIDILPAGIIPPNPQELLGSKRFAKILEILSKKYERIIIDSAPIQAVSDALLISKYANEVIYVVKADSTPHALAKAGIDKLKNIDANITGVVLNQLDTSKAEKYHTDGYYNSYYNTYGYAD